MVRIWPESTSWKGIIGLLASGNEDSPDLTSRADYLVKGQQSPLRDLILEVGFVVTEECARSKISELDCSFG